MGSEGSALQSDAIRCQATLGKLLAHLFWALLQLLGRNLYALSTYISIGVIKQLRGPKSNQF